MRPGTRENVRSKRINLEGNNNKTNKQTKSPNLYEKERIQMT
jgi:hypothetical protein